MYRTMESTSILFDVDVDLDEDDDCVDMRVSF